MQQTWDTKYMPNIQQICIVINDKAYDLKDHTGHVKHSSVVDMQLVMATEYIVSMLSIWIGMQVQKWPLSHTCFKYATQKYRKYTDIR